LAGNDLRDMKPEIHDILTNKEVIAVNQDPLAARAAACSKMAIWKSGPSRCRMEAARGPAESRCHRKGNGLLLGNLGYPSHVTASVRDLWRSRTGTIKQKFSATVAPIPQ